MVRVHDAALAEAEADGLVAATVSRARPRRLQGIVQNLAAYGYVGPALIILLVWQVLPILYTFWLSLHAMPTAIFTAPWVGFHNFQSMVSDPEFHQSLIATLQFTLGTVPVGALLALLLALLLFENLPGLPVFRTFVILPFITPVVATTVVWTWIFNPTYGFLDSILYWLHLPTINWFASPFWSMFILIAYTLWHEIGFTVLIMLAGLTAIDREMREAARIDGANWLREFRYITLPLMSPWIFFVLVVNSIGAFKVFTQALTLTAGGPEHFTELTGLLIYNEAFNYFNPPYAAAVSVAVLVLVAIGTMLQFGVSRRTVFYQ